MGTNPLDMMGMIMPAPQVALPVISYQQALSMVPAITKDVIILLTLSGTVFLAQAEPLTVWMPFDIISHSRRCQDTIARCLEEEAVMNIHQAVETEALLNPANLLQQLSTKSHQVSLDSIYIRPPRFIKLTQVIRHQAIWSHNSHVAVGQCHS